jgi:hypothetical protein
MGVAEDVKEQTQEMAEQAKPWIARLARLGIAAKGMVYLVLGFLTGQAALGLSRADVDINDALLEISLQPLGKPLLFAIISGLLGYVLWRFSQAIWDPKCSEPGWKGWKNRVAFGVNALVYSSITLAALQFLTSPNHQSDNTPRDLANRLLHWPIGRILVAAVGIVMAGVALSHFISMYKGSHQKELKAEKANGHIKAWTNILGRMGSAARGFIYSTVGFLFLQAAIYQVPYRAGGIGEALRALAFSPYGPFLLGILSFGVMAHGFYLALAALYNRVEIP